MAKKPARKALTPRQIRAFPATVGIDEAAAAFGIGRSLAYQLAAAPETAPEEDRFPCRVLRVRRSYRVRRADIMEVLGIPEAPIAAEQAEEMKAAS